MNEEQSSPIVIELAKDFIEFVTHLDPQWQKAFYRFRSEGLRYGSNASYIVNADVVLISALKNKLFYDAMNERGATLFKSLGKSEGVFLLSIDAQLHYDIKFEWTDLHRWEITKLNGGTGIPQGI